MGINIIDSNTTDNTTAYVLFIVLLYYKLGALGVDKYTSLFLLEPGSLFLY